MKWRGEVRVERVVRRVGPIVVAVLAMLVVVLVLRPGPERHGEFRRTAIVQEPDARVPIEAEIGPFRDLMMGVPEVATGEPSPHVVVLTRRQRRDRRAYEGAPPVVPHPVDPELERTQDCAPCHEFGGFNPPLRTYAPRTPHPEHSSCLQCHAIQVTDEVFVRTDWSYTEWPEYGEGGALFTSPPTIPHTLQMREHCLACHGGIAASPDIRTEHPERFNCRQCHVPAATGETFRRPAGPGGGS